MMIVIKQLQQQKKNILSKIEDARNPSNRGLDDMDKDLKMMRII